MYTPVIEAINQRLATVQELKYISDDWGQISFYGSEMPVQYPAALVLIEQAAFSNMGQQIQIADTVVVITLAYQRLTNVSRQSPTTQKTEARKVYDIIGLIAKALHGYKPTLSCGPMMRLSQRQIKREDGIVVIEARYRLDITDDIAKVNYQTKLADLPPELNAGIL